MSLKGQMTTATYMPWDTMVLLLQRLERDHEYKFQLLIAVGCYTALRIGDILKLRWSDFMEHEFLVVSEGKTKKARRIDLNPALVDIIERLYRLMGIVDPNELLFINRTKTKAINVQYINRKLKHIVKRYNIPIPNNSVSSHLFRKTMARHVWERSNYSEKSLIMVGEAFNHSSVRVTKRYLGIKSEEISDIYRNL
jgi:integrase